MTSLKDARKAWREATGDFLKDTPVRRGFLGDGRGQATSNLYVPGGDSELLWAREHVNGVRFFPVKNKGAVVPAFDLPIVIGYPLHDPRVEQIIRIDSAALGAISPSGIALLGPHHQQHEFGGGDVVFVDGLQFKPGLVKPLGTAGMQLQVLSFIYFWDVWKQFVGATTISLTPYKPASGKNVYVLIALDPVTNSLVYRPGLPFSALAVAGTEFDLARVPAPAGNEYPLAFILLESTTTVLDWGTINNNSIGDARLHVNHPTLNILDRLRQLEGYTGNEPSIATTGAGASSVDPVDKTLNGLTDVDTTGVTNSQTLVFNQATNRWIPGAATGGSFTLNINDNPILTGQTTLMRGNGASLSQSGASITIGTNFHTQTPTGVGASPVAGTSTSAAAGDHTHRGILSVLAGTGASVEISAAGCATVGMTGGSGWASAIQTPNRAIEVVYTNGSLTRLVEITLGLSSGSTTVQGSLQTGAASPPTTEIARMNFPNTTTSVVNVLTGMVMPSENYWLRQSSGSLNVIRWIEYDDYGGAPATALGDNSWLSRADGRLTLASGSPVDVTGIGSAASLYYTPYVGDQIGLVSSSGGSVITFSEVSLNLNSLSPNSNYDIFGFSNAGTLTLESNRWTNDTTRAAGLNRTNGTLVRSLDNTRRYLGTIRITGSSGWTADNTSQRYVWNNYNRIARSLCVIDTTDTWTYAVTAWRAANNSNANKVEYVAGISEDVVVATVLAEATVGTGIAGAMGIGIDSSTANAANLVQELVGTQNVATGGAQYIGYPGLGYHYIHWIEYRRAGTITFYGDAGIADHQSGLLAVVNA